MCLSVSGHACQETAAEWAVRYDTDAELTAHRDDVTLRAGGCGQSVKPQPDHEHASIQCSALEKCGQNQRYINGLCCQKVFACRW